MIKVTEAAALKIRDILKAQAQEDAALRVVAIGTGCATPQLLLALDHNEGDTDTVVVSSGVRFLLDEESATLTAGGRIDYVEDRLSRFTKLAGFRARLT